MKPHLTKIEEDISHNHEIMVLTEYLWKVNLIPLDICFRNVSLDIILTLPLQELFSTKEEAWFLMEYCYKLA